MRNGSLWSNVVFEKEVIFHEFDFETSDLEFEVSKSSIWKHQTSCDKGVSSFIIISQLRRPIELKFSQVCYFMHMLRYTKWEDWSLTITNSVQCLKSILYSLSETNKKHYDILVKVTWAQFHRAAYKQKMLLNNTLLSGNEHNFGVLSIFAVLKQLYKVWPCISLEDACVEIRKYLISH